MKSVENASTQYHLPFIESPWDFVKTFVWSEHFELTWRKIIEKHLCYPMSFKRFPWKDIYPNVLFISLKQEFCDTLFYHLPIKEIVDLFNYYHLIESKNDSRFKCLTNMAVALGISQVNMHDLRRDCHDNWNFLLLSCQVHFILV